MDFIHKRYQVTTIRDIVAGTLDRCQKRPIVAVTFDDGYLDNFVNAFPILRKHAVSAAFFVSTGIVGTDGGFQHDLNSLSRALPTMSWDNLRELRAAGHEIGSHTVNHVNLVQVSDVEAEKELAVSRDTIRSEIDVNEVAFAYCFGGRNDITAERRALVKSVGYTCCLGAFGGTNYGAIDLFDIKRFGVNWAYSQSAFQARIEGW